MKNSKNPKRIAIFVILFGLGIGGWFWYSQSNRQSGETYLGLNPKEVRTSAADQNSLRDSDQDGLKDWEETLWGTDPKNPDSDGDGRGDGLEIKERRDPTAEGPNDQYEPPQGEENINFTSQFSKAFANTIGPRLFQEGGLSKITPEDLETIPKFLPSTNTVLGRVPQVKRQDLIVSDRTEREAVKEYFNAVSQAYAETLFAQGASDVEILLRASERNNLKELEKLDPVVEELERAIVRVKKIPVPRGYESFALKELAFLSQTKRLVEILRNMEQDPLASLLALKARIDLSREVQTFHQETEAGLKQSGITFRQDEKGSLLFQ